MRIFVYVSLFPPCLFVYFLLPPQANPQLVLKLRMSGAVPLLPVYAFMEQRGTTLHGWRNVCVDITTGEGRPVRLKEKQWNVLVRRSSSTDLLCENYHKICKKKFEELSENTDENQFEMKHGLR